VVSRGFELEDAQTGMPTYVNGRPIRRQRLQNEDQVQIGSTVFLFQERRRQA
jgi:pSer/pThr/pTyr-binding forkhead associated (FHA) protein